MDSQRAPGRPSRAGFRLDEVWIEPELDRLIRGGETLHLEPKLTEVLLVLARAQGHVVSKDEILAAVWPHQFVAESTLSRAIAELRRALGDDAQQPRYIETIPRRGYRLMTAVERPSAVPPESAGGDSAPAPRRRASWAVAAAAAAVLVLAVTVVGLRRWRAAASFPRTIRSLAVLPLRNLSGDPAQEYFADGMTEALIGDLARIRSLRVISRTSAMSYKDTKKTLPEIARELGVDALVEGAVVKQGDQVRIHAQLVEGRSDRHMWANTYDGTLGNLLTLQGEIAGAIAQEIEAQVTPEETQLLVARKAVHPEARDACLRGVHLLSARPVDAANIDEAERLFQRALELQPDYARAVNGLAVVHEQRRWAIAGDADAVATESRMAETYATKAIALDPHFAWPHLILADEAEYRHDWAASIRHNREGLEAEPGNPSALAAIGDQHSLPLAERLVYYQRALELDPVNRFINRKLQRHYWHMQRYADAIAQGERLLRLFPDDSAAKLYLALTYIDTGRVEEGLEICRLDSNSLRPETKRGHLALGLARAGRKDEALRLLAEAKRGYPASEHAEAYAQAGDLDKAMADLEMVAGRGADMEVLAEDMLLDPLREDSRFRALLRRYDLAELPEILARARRGRRPQG